MALSPEEYRTVWEAKPTLRAVYRGYYRQIDRERQPGVTVEIGAGSGNLHDELTGVIATDIRPATWVDAVLDAQSLPLADGSVANLVGVDVLHHLERPSRFLSEAQRVLCDRGRIVLVEPAITPVSWAFYKLFHPEPIDLSVNPLEDGPISPQRDPFESNQAIPTLLAGRWRARLECEFPNLRFVTRTRLSLFVYPLSGGFRPWSLIPARLVEPLLRIDGALRPMLAPLMAFRLLLVLERHATG